MVFYFSFYWIGIFNIFIDIFAFYNIITLKICFTFFIRISISSFCSCNAKRLQIVFKVIVFKKTRTIYIILYNITFINTLFFHNTTFIYICNFKLLSLSIKFIISQWQLSGSLPLFSQMVLKEWNSCCLKCFH